MHIWTNFVYSKKPQRLNSVNFQISHFVLVFTERCGAIGFKQNDPQICIWPVNPNFISDQLPVSHLSVCLPGTI